MLEVLFAIPGIGTAFRWLGDIVFGITDEPNIILRDWKTVEVGNDPRPAWYHWLHVRCVNEQRTGRFKSKRLQMRTKTAKGCHARVSFRRIGQPDDTWWDYAPFAGGVELTYSHDLIANDPRAFIPLFLELDHAVPHPFQDGAWLDPGVYPTGKSFLGGVQKRLQTGRYDVTVEVRQGDKVLVSAIWNGLLEVGEDGSPLKRSLSPLPSTYAKPVKAAPTSRSRRTDWLREAAVFDALAMTDHYQRSPGDPMPGGIEKVLAMRRQGQWDIRGGLTRNVRKDVEVQCRAAGNLLRHTPSSRPRRMSSDDLQAWIQFVADNDEITTPSTGTTIVGDEQIESATQVIDVLTIASARTCRRCAAVEPPEESVMDTK